MLQKDCDSLLTNLTETTMEKTMNAPTKTQRKYEKMTPEQKARHKEYCKEYRRANKEKNLEAVRRYAKKHAVRVAAQTKAKKIQCPEGKVRHHWSYQTENALDIILMTKEDHQYYHRFLKYDHERLCWKTVGGCLLDTKDKHIYYIQLIKDFRPAVKNMFLFLELLGY